VTSVPASLWQFNHSDRSGVHSPKVEIHVNHRREVCLGLMPETIPRLVAPDSGLRTVRLRRRSNAPMTRRINVSYWSFSTEAANSAARPTSASPRKLKAIGNAGRQVATDWSLGVTVSASGLVCDEVAVLSVLSVLAEQGADDGLLGARSCPISDSKQFVAKRSEPHKLR